MVAKDARSSLEDLLKKMKPLLLVAGVPHYQIRMRSGRHKIETCAKAYDWLHNVFVSPEYEYFIYVWTLLPPEVWVRYDSIGLEETREQLLLAQAKKELLKLWKKNRPRLFGKDQKRDISFIDNSNMDSCRP